MIKAPVTSFDQALQGRVAGVNVSSSDGQPGTDFNIVIRGTNSLTQDNSPLYVIDGFPIENFSNAALNPEDIESMEVLKDAGATALYGARASNGVILITTKTGKVGKAEINLKAKVGMNYINNPYDFLGAKDFITAIRTAYDTTPWASKSSLDGASACLLYTSDAADE